MAKTIKFNLILDGNQVRTLDGLRENFSIEDIIGYYEKGILSRWLKVRGYDKEFDAVEAIDTASNIKEKIKSLIKIFNVETDDAKVEEGLEIIEYSVMMKELNAIYKEQAYEKKIILEDYHKGYELLINHIIENKDNMSTLKASAKFLENEYYGLFKLESGNLYERLLKEAPKAIFALLMFDAFRSYWIGEYTTEWITESINKNLLSPSKAKAILGDELKCIDRNTDGVFDEIVSEDKKVMLISAGTYAYARGVGKFGEKLTAEEINGKAPILNGLLFNCVYNGSVSVVNRRLYYVEV